VKPKIKKVGRAACAVAVCGAVMLALTRGVDAYLKIGTRVSNGSLVTVRWSSFPIRYFVTNRDVPGVPAPQLQQAIDRAFHTWQAVPNLGLSSQFVGFTAVTPSSSDGANVIGFEDHPELDRVLGATSFTLDTVTGEILESNIFLNTAFPWSVADGGEAGKQDVESIVVHELGHMHGLGHSALGETELLSGGGRRVIGEGSIMFPIAFTAGSVNRALHPDDIAGLSDIYGNATFRGTTGSITGHVTKNGAGVLGAHVVAFNPATGAMVGGFSLSDDGAFAVGALEPGTYLLRAEPLDDGDPGAFLSTSVNIDLDFRPAFYGNLVTVTGGATAGGIELKVVPK
jgi:hypothetical protein